VTEPPPRATFSDNVNQWVIYDAYLDDFAKQVSTLALPPLTNSVDFSVSHFNPRIFFS